ncbi:hypothetical protein [Cellvibrio fontiphilus]|uniref:EF-hand domain-containing protein n=1 Tax=Cellvibrio fontiphilus TaxID=1815559 RepID=A0ABV7FEK7_9GAMM
MMAKKYFVLLPLLLALTACQSAPKKEQGAVAKKTHSATPHQRSHGASAGHRHAFIKEYDQNSDGELTRAEFDHARAAHLRAMDSNQDQRIDETEYVQEFAARMTDEQKEHRTKQLKQAHVRFGVLDKDKDGDITVKEFAVSGTRMFAGWDLEEDGVINEKDPLPSP